MKRCKPGTNFANDLGGEPWWRRQRFLHVPAPEPRDAVEGRSLRDDPDGQDGNDAEDGQTRVPLARGPPALRAVPIGIFWPTGVGRFRQAGRQGGLVLGFIDAECYKKIPLLFWKYVFNPTRLAPFHKFFLILYICFQSLVDFTYTGHNLILMKFVWNFVFEKKVLK